MNCLKCGQKMKCHGKLTEEVLMTWYCEGESGGCGVSFWERAIGGTWCDQEIGKDEGFKSLFLKLPGEPIGLLSTEDYQRILKLRSFE